jgi:FtsZ-binding cell division protein ZapB
MLPPQDELEADLARLAEIQELRAENENLKQAIANTWRPEVVALRAEIERLKAYEQMWHEQYASDLVQARAENERLRDVEIVSLEAEIRSHVDEIERLRALIDKHNDECRECPVIEP